MLSLLGSTEDTDVVDLNDNRVLQALETVLGGEELGDLRGPLFEKLDWWPLVPRLPVSKPVSTISPHTVPLVPPARPSDNDGKLSKLKWAIFFAKLCKSCKSGTSVVDFVTDFVGGGGGSLAQEVQEQAEIMGVPSLPNATGAEQPSPKASAVEEAPPSMHSVLEHQRYQPIGGWGNTLLPHDLVKHSNFTLYDTGKKLKVPDLASISPPSGFCWDGEWETDMEHSHVGEEGWEYAFDMCVPSCLLTLCVYTTSSNVQ